ncbi:glycoside hydrolase [Fulvivirga maritima]|uniref:sialidase family protein n=1 Tax=Fulvivirga maritima TaxID=2904247 RepID=UPI001F1D0786|nr:sialidase family protein [Fulvivirga maritima]UII25803.1 glycoside hydrolase [Fulvivirga maritima]
MKEHKLSLIIILSVLFCCNQGENTALTHDVIDINSKADGLSIFAENIISTPLYERDMAINPEGNEMIYTLGDYKQTARALVILEKTDSKWREPKIMSISGKYQDIEPFYANNGNRLFFASNRPIYNDSSRTDYNIWYSDKIDNRWTEPLALDSVINTEGDEFFPSLSEKGNLFFTATRGDGVGKEDIFMSEFKAGKFTSPIPLPIEINSEMYEFNAYISPQEDLIIFSSYGRSDDLGGGDLYFSIKDAAGNWSQSKNMGKLINSNRLDFCPFIDWENRNFYFTSERTYNSKETIKSVDGLKQKANSPLNGFGNIYRIGLDKLEIE